MVSRQERHDAGVFTESELMAQEADTEEITITCTWRSTHQVEVPMGWRPGPTLDDSWPEGVLDELTSQNAELVDWE